MDVMDSIRQDAKKYDYSKQYTMSYDPMNSPVISKGRLIELLSNPSSLSDQELDNLMTMGHNEVLMDYFTENRFAQYIFKDARATTSYVNATLKDNDLDWRANVVLATRFAMDDIYTTDEPEVNSVMVNVLGRKLIQFDYSELVSIEGISQLDMIRIALLRNYGKTQAESFAYVFQYLEESITDAEVTVQFVIKVLECLHHYATLSISTILESLIFPSNWISYYGGVRQRSDSAATIAMIEYDAVLTILDQSPMMGIKQSLIKLCTDITGYTNIIRGVYDKMKTFPRIARAIDELEREESIQFTLQKYN